MQIDDFKSVISTFADPGTEMLFEKTKVIFSINDEIIDISISTKYGDVYVDENQSGNPVNANQWIVRRLANLPLLASRLKERIKATPYFVSPEANILQTLESKPDETVNRTTNTIESAFETLNERSPLETSVIYITSDAGEGKTSLINEMARQQAQRFSNNESDWLLVPIPLGGRHFLRFDDITVGALQNRYRFPYLYYNSFLALVRMGVIIPAFDGFEEMFVENSTGEALSAMGILVGTLNSTGAVLIAARKAYFEFENLKSQEKLYDSISSYSVGFGKIELQRWKKAQFLDYCTKRGIENIERTYQSIAERIGEKHPLLTRPVLVKRLLDIVSESSSFATFIEKVNVSGTDYFSVFVMGIIEREANEKWIDRSGEIATPLLSAKEHCELLSLISIGMWEARVDYLKRDLLEFLSDYYCESKRKTTQQTQQIRERIRGHALLVTSSNAASAVEFDHDEFRLFFLGEGLAEQLRPLTEHAKTEVLATLRKGILPEQSQMAFLRAVKRNNSQIEVKAAKFLTEIAALDGHASYTQENCATLTIQLLHGLNAEDFTIKNQTLSTDALRDCHLENIMFMNCYFSPSSLENSQFKNCKFENCKFAQLKFYNTTSFKNCSFSDCLVETIKIVDKNLDLYAPEEIEAQLSAFNLLAQTQANIFSENVLSSQTTDDDLYDFEKLLRYFLRSTHIGTSVILIKLSERGQHFLDKVLPVLLELEILLEIENRSGNTQRRFKLGKSLEKLNEAVASAHGSFNKFTNHFKTN